MILVFDALGRALAGSLQNLTGHPPDNHQGVFDLVADVSRHLAQGGEALRLQEFFLELSALSQVPEKPHRGRLLIAAVNETGGEFDGNLLSGLAQPHGFIMDHTPRAAIVRAIYFCPDLLGDAGRIELGYVDLANHFILAIAQNPFRAFIKNDSVAEPIVSNDAIVGGLDELGLEFEHQLNFCGQDLFFLANISIAEGKGDFLGDRFEQKTVVFIKRLVISLVQDLQNADLFIAGHQGNGHQVFGLKTRDRIEFAIKPVVLLNIVEDGGFLGFKDIPCQSLINGKGDIQQDWPG